MPYYCTVPRCTSMAGKAKNVSFHQFPRDEELAKLWNRILKRGKPYTKYSKVCSLHFKPEDYTITSVGKNKGQWRTLRKDAIPSQNLPSESPVPYTTPRRSDGCWVPSQPTLTDPMVQQQMAQAIYMQTMLAMQAAGASESLATGDQPRQIPESTNPSPSGSSLSEIELLLRRDAEHPKEVTYKCHECSKCFKDPDVFILHKRTHKNTTQIEKENFTTNIQDRDETLRANPILANLLKTSMRLEPESNMSNILTVENQIMAALASNMEAYIRTLSSMLTSQANRTEENNDEDSDYDETNDMTKDGVKDNDSDSKDDMCIDTNSNDKSIDEETKDLHKDVQERFNVQVTACVSGIETPIDENQVFSNDVNIADDLTKDLKDTLEDIVNQSVSNEISMNDESIEMIEAQPTQNHENEIESNVQTESIRDEEIRTQNEEINENFSPNESKINDEESERDSDENRVNSVDTIVTETEAFEDVDAKQMWVEDNNITYEEVKTNDEMNVSNGELNHNPGCDTDIRIEIELEST